MDRLKSGQSKDTKQSKKEGGFMEDKSRWNYSLSPGWNKEEIQILKWDSDIGNEISKSDLVICVPYSSPALIAKYLGIPTIFYTPSLDFKLDLIHEDILVVQGSTELRRFLKELEN